MSGIHLFIAIAALGVDVRWDRTTDGQLVYAIAIEPELVESMRDGQAVTGSIPASVRDLRYFKISVESPGARRPTTTTPQGFRRDAARSETQVDYGWRPADDGGVEYLVQIRPERLRSLLDGHPIEGEVELQAGEVRRFYVFVGVGELPRDRYANRSSGDLAGNRGLDSAGSTFGQNGLSSVNQRFADNRAGSGGRSFPTSGSRASDDYRPTIRRNQGSYDFDDRAPAFTGDDRRGGLLAADSPRRSSGAGFDDYSSNYPPARPSGDRGSAFTQDHSPTAHDYQPMSNRTSLPSSGGRGDGPPPSTSTAWQTSAANQAPPSSGYPPTAGALAPATRPWAPLIMTTLGLFVSIATNTYLGWLAWTYFWRYREVASELARSRSDVLANRQAA